MRVNDKNSYWADQPLNMKTLSSFESSLKHWPNDTVSLRVGRPESWLSQWLQLHPLRRHLKKGNTYQCKTWSSVTICPLNISIHLKIELVADAFLIRAQGHSPLNPEDGYTTRHQPRTPAAITKLGASFPILLQERLDFWLQITHARQHLTANQRTKSRSREHPGISFRCHTAHYKSLLWLGFILMTSQN